MVTAFNVKSDRIHDIELTPGTTVGELRRQLAAGGYDVNEALITVNRYGRNDKLIGSNAGYALQPGDTVEFKTRDCDLPALRNMLGRLTAKPCGCGDQCRVRQQAPAQKAAGCSRGESEDGQTVLTYRVTISLIA